MTWIRSHLRVALALVLVFCAGALWLKQPVIGHDPLLPLPEVVDSAKLQVTVHRLSVEFRPRDSRHPENLDRAADFIRSELQAAGGRVSDQEFTADGHQYRNLIARFGPEEGERVVVGAHYDAYSDLPAADDNASGTAGLLALARLLGRSTLNHPVELVAYTLEEPPYFGSTRQGSAVHAKSLRLAGVKLRAMLCLEMIGYYSDRSGSQEYPHPALKLIYPTRGNFLAVVGRGKEVALIRRVKRAMQGGSLPIRSLNDPIGLIGTDLSDHASYWREGYPAVMLTDSAFYRNQAYHEAGDTEDRLDYARMAQAVAATYQAVMRLAE